MKKNSIFIGLFVFLFMQIINAQNWQEYSGFDITEDGGVPVIKVYGPSTSTPLFPPLTIKDGSLLNEYIMARLISTRNVPQIAFIDGAPKKYLFKYLTQSNAFRKTNKLEAIGFYENGSGSVFLEVYILESTPVTFELTASDSPEKKLKFDYMIAALVDYYTSDDAGTTPVILKEGTTPIGIEFRVK